MKHIKLILIIIAVISSINMTAQDLTGIQKRNLSLVSPTAYQFLKFGEIPVNEYTGSPNIDIPLFNVDIRGFSLPLKLQYHSKGIQVSEEADWVGLGWNLGFSSITQIVNDKDDLDPTFNIKNNFPYTYSTLPYTFTVQNANPPTFRDMYIDDLNTTSLGDQAYSFITYQKSINGDNPGGWNPPLDFGNLNYTDFEKDVFVANVLGEQLYILMKFGTSDTSYVVLNKKGYSVKCKKNFYNNFSWKIINPSGITCYFNETNDCNRYSSTGGVSSYDNTFSDKNTLLGYTTTPIIFGSETPVETSRIWQISKIISTYGDTITFNYNDKKSLSSENFSTQWKLALNATQTFTYDLDCSAILGMTQLDGQGPIIEGSIPYYMKKGTIDDIVISKARFSQDRSYLKSICYNHNVISFYTSNRDDWSNAQKLDSIVVKNSLLQNVKSVKFVYDYYISSYIGRGINVIGNYDTQIKRLRLNSVTNQSDEKYYLTYNSTPLPPKNSFATDYWGYYNGQINNLTPIANISDFNSTPVSKFGSLILKNTAIKYSVENYCKAGLLEKIQYPTGGSSKLFYSLNCFDNFSVPNDPARNDNTKYFGDGLKIDSIINCMNDNSVSSTKHYIYEKGKLQIPLKFYYEKSEEYIDLHCSDHYAGHYYANIFNLFSNSCFSLNILGDGNGVGYDKVTSYLRNSNSNGNGKIVHYYSNNPDVVYSVDESLSVPAYHKGVPNGSLLREVYYDNNNKINNATNFNYTLLYDKPVEYNGKATYLGKWGCNSGYKQMLISYYPIFKPEIVLKTKQSADYFDTDSVVTSDFYNYNSYNIVSYKSMTTSNTFQGKSEFYLYPYDIYNNTSYAQDQRNIMQTLISQNRLDEKIQIESTIYTKGLGSPKTQYAEYDATKLLPNVIKTRMGNNNPLETNLTLLYDSKKNIVEKREKDNIPTTYLWGYNSQYPIAEIKNTTYDQVKAALGVDPEVLAATSSPDISKVDALRTKFPSALITSYNYKPLVGMTSITNPRGITTRYVYDPNNRLELVRDNHTNIVNQYRYAYQNMGENNGLGTTSPLSATLIKDGSTYYKVSDVASVSVAGGSGNFGYSWYLKNSGGTTLQSSINSSSSQFNFSSTESGSLTLQCVITDYLTNNSITVTKSITCLFPTLSANITTNSTIYSSIQATGMAAASTYIATINISGGSGNYIVLNWSFIDNSTSITLQGTSTPYYLSQFSFVCTKSGSMNIKCMIGDNVTGENLTIYKQITVN